MHDARTQAAIDAGHPEWAELPSTRAQASAVGSPYIFNGKPCVRGHISKRTKWGHCLACDKKEPTSDNPQNLIQRRRLQAAVDAGHPEWAELASTAAKARATSDRLFFSGRSCPHGHVAPRYTKGSGCLACLGVDVTPTSIKDAERLQVAIEAGHPEWAELPKSGPEALAQGVRKYFSPKPCPSGHIGLRWAQDCFCVQCSRDIAIRALHDQGRLTFDEAEAAKILPEPERRKAAIAAGHPEWADLPTSRRQAIETGATRYFFGSPCDKGHVSPRQRFGGCSTCNRDWEQSEVGVARRKAWEPGYYSQPEIRARLNAYESRHRAKKRNASPWWLTEEHWDQIESFYADAARLTQETGIPHHVDHIIPLVHPDVCGLHVPWNLQVLASFENRSKSNKFDGTMENESWRVDLSACSEQAAA